MLYLISFFADMSKAKIVAAVVTPCCLNPVHFAKFWRTVQFSRPDPQPSL